MNNILIKKIYGFTLVEVIIVMASFAIIISSTAILTAEKTYKDILKAKAHGIVDLISQAHNFAVSGYYGDNWSINVMDGFQLCTDDRSIGDCVVLFKGNNFESRNQEYDRILKLGKNVSLQFDGEGNEQKYYFSKISGWATTTDSWSFDITNDLNKTKTIFIKPSGLIYYTN